MEEEKIEVKHAKESSPKGGAHAKRGASKKEEKPSKKPVEVVPEKKAESKPKTP